MVSEFMLQQTRVETVAPYYGRWLVRFPDWSTLAAAPLDDVLLEWKGLGYYSRARNLHLTARTVRDRYGGELPADPATLRTLPGVGEYTAGAVASIAFGKPVPAVDGNVRRVLARLLDIAEPTPARLRREAARLLDPSRPGDHNEAMMELGATICTPRAPRCEACPVADWCAALAAGTVAERPARPGRRPVPRVDYATVVAIDPAGRVLLVKRPEKGLLAGMWEFPSVEFSSVEFSSPEVGEVGGNGAPSAVTAAALKHLATLVGHGRESAPVTRQADGLTRQADGPTGPAARLPPVRHAFTHLRATYHPVVIPCDPGRTNTRTAPPNTRTARPATWTHPARFDDYALPVAQQKIARLLEAWMRTAGDSAVSHS